MLPTLQAGMRVGQGMVLTQPLGRGGFGEVWEAVGKEGRVVALKFLDCRHRTGPMIVNEVRRLLALRNVRHPHILSLEDVSLQASYLILKMERADGSLHDLHRVYREETGSHVPPQHLCELLFQAALALDFLAGIRTIPCDSHNGGLQHCDVKPRNLLLVGDVLKVADFGLCTSTLNGQSERSNFGTPGYAPPEFAEGKITPRSDQFSLAVTYCELRTGRLPFEEEHRPGRPAPTNLSGLSVSERMVVSRALEPQWLNRWPNCIAFVRALMEAVSVSSATAASAQPQVSQLGL
ncbi:MAG: serine/threonine protein kinase [Gemmatales bacterium]|nr:serine/threonine protein kinase [Gemmatales bacterium]MDW8387392.1 serine/threonine-protein kinase [Gemmatales bacterium]